MKHEGLSSAAALLGVALDESQVARLARYERLLAERGAGLGAISDRDVARLRERHVLDSLRAAKAVDEADRTAYDLGSGAGLPGIVVAVAAPSLQMTLVEARTMRGAFLELAVEVLNLPNARVAVRPAESLSTQVDVCFARAFADATSTWRVAAPMLRPHGRLVYFAGEAFDPSSGVPPGVSWRILPTPAIARRGSLVIMSQQ